MSWSLVDITPWIPTDRTCINESAIKHLPDDTFLVYLGCPEATGGELNVAKKDGTKTTKVSTSSYNRALFHKLFYYSKKLNSMCMLSGYGEAYAGAECGNYGDLWVWYGGQLVHKCLPYSNNVGNLFNCFYDVKTGKLFCPSTQTGWRIYRLSPDGTYEDDWVLGSGGYADEVSLIPLDEDSFLLAWNHGGRANTDFYKCTWDTLRNRWKATANLVDSCTKLFNWAGRFEPRTLFVKGGYAYALVPPNKLVRISDTGVVDVNTFNVSIDFMGEYLGYIVAIDYTNHQILILNENGNTVASVSDPDIAPWSGFMNAAQQDLPFLVGLNSNKSAFKVKALAYNSVVPTIQYDSTTGKFRCIDYLTGNPITCGVRVYDSAIVYPKHIYPIKVTPSIITISGWTSIPSTRGALTLVIDSVLV